MAGSDYIGSNGIDSAAARWQAAIDPYVRRGRPVGDAARSALLVIDMQRFFCDRDSHAFLPAALRIAPQLAGLCAVFREAGSPVVFTRHALRPGEDPGRMAEWWRDVVREGHGWAELSSCVAPAEGDVVLRKTRYDAFAGTGLGPLLSEAGVNTVVIGGVMTHLCCESTAREAFRRGLHVWVAADGTASVDEALHLGALRSLAHGFAHIGTVATIGDWRRSRAAQQTGAVAAAAGADAAMNSDSPLVDVVVVGAGPAGLAAAVQAARHGLEVRLLEQGQAGGLLRNANLVENYLGTGWLTGPELVQRLLAQARQANVRPEQARVHRLTLLGAGRFRVELDRGEALSCRAVILATGTAPRPAGFPGEDELVGSRLFYAVADLLDDWTGPPAGSVAIVGSGDAAFDQALGLHRRGWQVQLLMRGEHPRALPLLIRRVEQQGIPVKSSTCVQCARADGQGVELCWNRRGRTASVRVDRVLVAVGRQPHLPRIEDARTAMPPEVIDDIRRAIELDGVHLVGDLTRGRYRQAAMAAGDGVEAAMRVADQLAKEATA